MKKQMRCSVVNVIRSLGTAMILSLVLMIGFISHADEGVIKGTDVNVRSDASTTATAVGTVTANDKVTISEEKKDADGKTWYKITTSTGITGYVRSDFVTKSSSESNSNSNTTTTTTTTVTAVDEKTAYIAGNGNVNIRKEASSKSTLVASAKGQSEVTITGEAKAADGYKWYEIKFKADGKDMKGFIRSDLITFTAPVNEPAETTIEGNTGDPTVTEPDGDVPADEPDVPDEPIEEDPATSNAISKNITFLEPDEEPPYVPDGFEKVKITIGGEQITGWGKGDFYILYAIKGESDPAWYVCDYKNGGYVNYDGLFEPGKVKTTSNFDGRILIIVLAGLLVVALVVIALLAIKLSQRGDDYDGYDYDYDDEEETDEYAEEFGEGEEAVEEEYEEEAPAKPAKKEKTHKAEKSSRGGLKGFFTKEVDDDEEYDELEGEEEEAEVTEEPSGPVGSSDSDDDDDDDDFNFIDL